jgi:hypothetical protein
LRRILLRLRILGVLALDVKWVLRRLSDLEEAVGRVRANSRLAFPTEIILLSLRALVPDSSDRTDVTAVTYDVLMNNGILFCFLFSQMLQHKFLVLL